MTDILSKIPKHTYNGEPFGLCFMPDGGSDTVWTCKYFSHFSSKSDDRFPVVKGNSIEECAEKMREAIAIYRSKTDFT
jgi:hypothetical protein